MFHELENNVYSGAGGAVKEVYVYPVDEAP